MTIREIEPTSAPVVPPPPDIEARMLLHRWLRPGAHATPLAAKAWLAKLEVDKAACLGMLPELVTALGMGRSFDLMRDLWVDMCDRDGTGVCGLIVQAVREAEE